MSAQRSTCTLAEPPHSSQRQPRASFTANIPIFGCQSAAPIAEASVRFQATLRERDFFHREDGRTGGRDRGEKFWGSRCRPRFATRLRLLNLGGIFFNSVFRIEKCVLASLRPPILPSSL